MKAMAAETGKMFANEGISSAAANTRRPHASGFQTQGSARLERVCAHAGGAFGGRSRSHYAQLQLKRPTLWEMETELRQFSVPLMVIVGDEDDLCLDGSVFLKRTVPTAALLVVPRAGHTINSEEPAAVNAALAELFSAAEAGRWLAHKPA
jgi:pimeloyl-ACP methyl ester carboxylesterase